MTVEGEQPAARRYVSDVSVDDLRAVIAAKRAERLPNNTKSTNAQHDSLNTTREPRQIRSPPIHRMLSADQQSHREVQSLADVGG